MTPAGRVLARDFGPVALFMAAVMLAFASQIHVLMIFGTALCALYAWIDRSRASISHLDLVRFSVACLLFLPAFAKPYHGLSPIYYFLSTVAVFFAAQVTARKSPILLLKAFRCLYAASIVAIAWILHSYWGEVEPLGMVIEGSSTNAIPAYLIVIQIGLSLCSYVARGRLPIVTPFLTIAVAFLGNGRSSLVVAGLIVAATLVLNLTAGGRSQRTLRLASVSSFVLVALGLVLLGDEFFEWIMRYTKLSVGLVDTNRLEIWGDYWGKIDGLTLLLGADYEGTVIESKYNGNPHIAYIRTHSFFGLPLTTLALLSPWLVVFARKTFSAKVVFFTFISLAALRAFSEPIFFPTLLDYFYFSYFFIYFNHAPRSPRWAATAASPGPTDVEKRLGIDTKGIA